LIQAYLTATPSRNTPLLFLGFLVLVRLAAAAFEAGDFLLRAAEDEPCRWSGNYGPIVFGTIKEKKLGPSPSFRNFSKQLKAYIELLATHASSNNTRTEQSKNRDGSRFGNYRSNEADVVELGTCRPSRTTSEQYSHSDSQNLTS
jgi:hypothetical protein